MKMNAPSIVQRSFLEWVSESAPRFAVPIAVKESSDRSLDLEFVGCPALSATLTSSEIIISVEWHGECWDILLSFDVSPQRTENGYICRHCAVERRATFPDLDALWRDHLFDPLLRWVNEKLAIADALGLYGSPARGWTYAELLTNCDAQKTEPDIRIPIRVPRQQ